jgi:surfactin synthase thioesterase subunit
MHERRCIRFEGSLEQVLLVLVRRERDRCLQVAIHKLSDADFLERLADIGGMPTEVLENQELLELLINPLRADFEAIETWRYAQEPPLAVPVDAYGGWRTAPCRGTASSVGAS